MGPSFRERLATQPANVIVRIAHPSGRGRVCGIAFAEQQRFPLRFALFLTLEQIDRFIRCQRIGDVAEVDASDDLSRCHVREQFPDRLSLALAGEIPHRIDDGGHRKVNDALLRPEPAKLRFTGKRSPERRRFRDDLLEGAADDEVAKRSNRLGADFVATADREREAMPLDIRVGFQDDVCGGVVRVRMHRVGARIGPRGWKPKVHDFEVTNLHGRSRASVLLVFAGLCLSVLVCGRQTAVVRIRSNATAATMMPPVTICCTQFASPC